MITIFDALAGYVHQSYYFIVLTAILQLVTPPRPLVASYDAYREMGGSLQ